MLKAFQDDHKLRKCLHQEKTKETSVNSQAQARNKQFLLQGREWAVEAMEWAGTSEGEGGTGSAYVQK